jgi:hypothetical protein
MPMLAIDAKRHAQLFGPRLNHRQGLFRLRPDHARHAALQDPGLFARNLGQRLAQILLMVDS